MRARVGFTWSYPDKNTGWKTLKLNKVIFIQDGTTLFEPGEQVISI